MNLPGKAQQTNTYDAIVIGSGISGGWAAKELCDRGLKTLVLERGRSVQHGEYPTATKNPWDFPHRQQFPPDYKQANPIVDRCYAFEEATDHFFVKDEEHPYVQEKPFRLDTGLPDRRKIAHLGASDPAVERLRI